MSHDYKVDIDTNSDSKPKLDADAIEMVFGTPNSPKVGTKPEILIANERTHGRDTHTSNKHEANGEAGMHFNQPLLEPDKEPPKPPLAGPEIDDLDEVDDHATVPFHGIDDGLLDNHIGHEGGDSKEEGREGSDDERAGNDDGNRSTDQADHPDGFDSDNELGTRFGLGSGPISPFPEKSNTIENTYQQRKNLAQGMMDLALLSANSNQLRYVIESSSHPYYYPSVMFISISIILQIIVGILLILNSRYDVKDKAETCKAVKINNLTVLGVFLVTIVNVFISSFSVAPTTNASTGGAIVQQAG